jgi:hypothetical protein
LAMQQGQKDKIGRAAGASCPSVLSLQVPGRDNLKVASC